MAKILILEDDTDLSTIWREELERAGHQVSPYRGGPQALEALKTGKFDLLISDIFIRDKGELVPDGGLSLISRLRMAGRMPGAGELRNIKVLAISGGAYISGGYDPLRLARDLGADSWMRKPVDLTELLDAVEVLVSPVTPAGTADEI